MMRPGRGGTRRILIYAGLLSLLVFSYGPIYWLLLTSMRTERQIYNRTAMLMPRNLTLANYVYALTEKPLLLWISNSLLVSLSSAFVALAISVLGAYALARLRFPGRQWLARLLVYTYMVPRGLLFIPLFVTVGRLGLLDSRTGLTLAYLSMVVPYCSWLLLGFFMTIPKDIEDAAKIDGCSTLGVLFRVVLPLSMAGLAATFVMGFTEAWNEFLYAAVLLYSDKLKTAPLGLLTFRSAENYLWGSLSAAALLVSAPTIILFIVAHKNIVGGLTVGAVKG